MPRPRATTPAQVIRAQVVLEEHDVSSDGAFAVVVRRFVVADRYRSHLWLIPLARRGRPIQLTSGPVRDTWPRISPDGSSVAFKRTPAATRGRARRGPAEDPGEQIARLRVLALAADGTPARTPWHVRTPKDRSIGELAWSPDGTRLGFTMDVDPPRFIVGEAPTGDDAPIARRITRIDWRYDEAGHLDRWAHLHVVDARRGASSRQLTSGEWSAGHIAWSPDGSQIAFDADPRPDADVHPRRTIWTITADAGAGLGADGDSRPEPREVLALGQDVHSPAWSPDGRLIAAVGYVAPDALDDTSPELVVGPADGSSPAWPLDPELDRPIGNWTDSDLHGWTQTSRVAPAWLDQDTVVAVVSDRGMSSPWIYAVDPATGRPAARARRLTSEPVSGVSLAVAPRDGAGKGLITMLACLGDRPMELVSFPVDGAPPRARTQLGGRWATGFEWPELRRIEAPGPGGAIETWIASPRGAGDQPMPTIVDVHGGPLGAWAAAPSIEVVLLCAAGYRVILPNIRGSTGYGRDWIRPQLNDWGGVDAADVHAAVDEAIALGLADAERTGVLGLSYGGFMTNWLVGTSDRFKGAVAEAGVANQVSAWGNSDTAVAYNDFALLGRPLDREGVDNLWRQSPLANVASIRTPLLILQGEADQRCPPGDNEQLFVALRVLGRTVEYVLYPEESHVYQAAGRPDRRIDRMERVIAWFDRFVKGSSQG
jgi:dipeptidyl aminopeptidase/acylaminoacyl peptidase